MSQSTMSSNQRSDTSVQRAHQLDGELCAVRADGTTSFAEMQAATDNGRTASLVFFTFDLLYVDGKDLTKLPLLDR
jgi:ATP-dependent DNA ligase